MSQSAPNSDRPSAATSASRPKVPSAYLTLGQKGLIIIGVPVLIQLFFFFQLASQHEQSKLNLDANAREAQHQKEMGIIYSYAFIDLAVGVAAILLFTNTIAVRLKALTENTRQFVDDRVVAPPLHGTDEVGQLDTSIRQIIADLKALEARKKAVVAMVNNEFIAPLHAVVGTVDLIGAGLGGALDDKGHKLVDSADQQLTRLLKLTNAWLAKERPEAGVASIECKNVELNLLVQSAMDSLLSLAQKQNVKIVPVNVECAAYADERQLQQVILILLGNALKYSPMYGSIKLAAIQSPEWLTVSVSDKGRGFAPEVCEKIFDRLQSNEGEEQNGTYLGLAICKSIVQAHKGEIGVKSELGKGSTFWFRIPATATAQLSVVASTPSPSTAPVQQ
ncbi:MAG TPA: HAMP domain-containing sensor histidine kinase [Planktothrix sp.]|jgi:signal transduction histidine kinase